MLLPEILLFLYFPDDKSEYVPAFIKLAIMVVVAVLVMRIVIKWSKKEEKKAQELERQLKIKANEKDS